MCPPADSPASRDPDPSASFDAIAARLGDAAEAIAHGYHHDYVGTEHFLQAALEAYPAEAAALLGRYGVTPHQACKALAVGIATGPGPEPSGRLPQTPRLKKALRFAQALAPKPGEPDHATAILLALAHQTDATAAGVLSDLGIHEDAVRAVALERDQQDAAAESPRPAVEPCAGRRPANRNFFTQPVAIGSLARRILLLACITVAAVSLTCIGLAVFAISLAGVGQNPVAAVLTVWIFAVMTAASGWMAVRLWHVTPADGATLELTWVIEVMGIGFLFGAVDLFLRGYRLMGGVALSLALAALLIRRQVRRRVRKLAANPADDSAG